MKQVFGLLTLMLLTLSACNNMTDKSSKQQNQNTEMKQIKIVRQFEVLPDKVFAAFTKPNDMIVWWTSDTKFDIDLRVGGQYTITRTEGKDTFVMTGKYLEVEQPNKLKYTCAMPDFSPVVDTITVEIKPDGKRGSQLIFIQVGEGISEELRKLPEGTISDTEKGWNYGFDLMEKSWKQNKK
ncbi:SRPBCC domain-containing protein [bacterium SCSIO 12741]|nr:SRPBCC domain-containing protein [bacterium SCSIO 12741]